MELWVVGWLAEELLCKMPKLGHAVFGRAATYPTPTATCHTTGWGFRRLARARLAGT